MKKSIALHESKHLRYGGETSKQPEKKQYHNKSRFSVLENEETLIEEELNNNAVQVMEKEIEIRRSKVANGKAEKTTTTGATKGESSKARETNNKINKDNSQPQKSQLTKDNIEKQPQITKEKSIETTIKNLKELGKEKTITNHQEN
ncbi:hypothetical protein PIB30_050848 [Stylosanthes scabra]|uniref:Uncharacterized protein n=1 Tax=Stylosanthes scabra TaxID=79078 RepID=A0ABU6YGC5_9FABA|nr:hypothetical protein [Stylosanthes scabra]